MMPCAKRLQNTLWFLLSGLVLFSATVIAEPTALPGDKVKGVQLKLTEKAGEPGRWARSEVRLRGDGLKRVYVRGLDVSAPISVQVIGERLDAPVEVTLHRHTWGKVEASGSTSRSGTYRFSGRAHGDLGVGLRSADGTPTKATVIIWQGDPVPPSFTAVYAAPGTPRAIEAGMPAPAGGGSSSLVLWAILAALVVIAALLAGLLMKRRGGGTAAALMLGLALLLPPTPADAADDAASDKSPPAQATDKPADKDGTKQSNSLKDKPPVDGEAVPNPFDVPTEKPPVDADKPAPEKPDDKPIDKDGTKQSNSRKDKEPADSDAVPDPFDVPEDSGWKPSPRDGEDAPKPEEDSASEDDDSASDDTAAETDSTADSSYEERIAAAEQANRDLAAQVESNRAEIERLRFLIESDRDNEPSPANVPPMPLSCRPPLPQPKAGDGIVSASESEAMDDAFDAAWEKFEECKRCYQQPLADFEAQILLYEKLRSIYSGTKKYVDNVITTGDSLAKPHYLLENAWAAQKLDIRVTFAKTGQAYDAKLIEFNEKLSGILDRIGECEATENNNPMWRQTSGLFFYQTMANSYKRPD